MYVSDHARITLYLIKTIDIDKQSSCLYGQGRDVWLRRVIVLQAARVQEAQMLATAAMAESAAMERSRAAAGSERKGQRLPLAGRYMPDAKDSAMDFDRNYGSQPWLSGHEILPVPMVQLPAEVPAFFARHNMDLITLDNGGTAAMNQATVFGLQLTQDRMNGTLLYCGWSLPRT